MGFNDYYSAINEIENLLRMDLIGPVKEDEILYDEAPLNTYTMGILWPQRTSCFSKRSSEIQDDEILEDLLADEGDEFENVIETGDNPINITNNFCPSAMAISAMVTNETSELRVHFGCAKYEYFEELVNIEKDGEVTPKAKVRYRRIPQEYDVFFDIRNVQEGIVYPKNSNPELPEAISITVYIRKHFDNGDRLLTVSVVNTLKSQNREIPKNQSALFQCELVLETSKCTFVPLYKQLRPDNDKDPESSIIDMLYRQNENYAYGHGCSVRWNETNGEVFRIDSEFLPSTEVLQMMPRKIPSAEYLKMNYWKSAGKEDGIKSLVSFINLYQDWFKAQEDIAKKLPGFNRAINTSLANIQICISRLSRGIGVLENNDIVWRAFKYANEAMMLQRNRATNEDVDTINWYPFQLAYILQIIPDIVDNKSEFRDVVDLLWFPTGGGKTEAYLGVSAFTIFYRRLSNQKNADGVTIIMRYTLRLLTKQQFERATALICACEYLRKIYSISDKEISIGLWVGSDMSPNTLKDAAEKIDMIKEDTSIEIHKGNPQQIYYCPWCGQKLDIGCYEITDRLNIRCKNNKDCFFYDSLPIYLIDDDIYIVRPTLLLSTVDKFARIVWEERAGNLFGTDGVTLPPELIIQDELHLISGPLGSIAGIYETAIDRLCWRNGIRPKIIASTATAKQVNKQIQNLYERGHSQFPPNGINNEDSFFAVQANRNDKPARRYLGLTEPGGSMADLLIRVYACLFFATNYLNALGVEREVIDQYWTIVGYFNSLKDLGGSSTIISDRVKIQLESLVKYKFKHLADAAGLDFETIDNWEFNELTSRKTSKQINEALEGLKREFGKDEVVYSYVLASNMLSVGLDIGRLGLMTVYSQPKTNAEYIQATSRVGRSKPGLVISMYNSMRSRDKSHYEQFGFYHQNFYQYVEATSVTPFSKRSVDKALHAVFIALVRHTVKGMRGNNDAANFRKDNPQIRDIRNYLLDRIAEIEPVSLDYAEEQLLNFENLWEYYAFNKEDFFVYDANRCKEPSLYLSLLTAAERENLSDFPSTLNSLRNVDSSSNIFLAKRGVNVE